MVLKHIKNRIQVVNFMRKITDTMKLVSASQFKNYEKLLINSKKYLSLLKFSILNLYHNDINFNTNTKNTNNIRLFVLFGSDKSLCGSFNHKLTNSITRLINPSTKLLCVGKKIYQNLKIKYSSYIIGYVPLFPANNRRPNIHLAFSLVKNVYSLINKYKLSSCNIVYHNFNSFSSISIVNSIFTPIEFSRADIETSVCYPTRFDSSLELISKIVIKKYLNAFIFNVYCNSIVSENAYRMLSMENANKNSNKRLKELKLLYNKNRQHSITKELIEVISGSEGLKK